MPEDDLPALPDTPTGFYRHYKGGEYEVMGAARHSETLEPLVLYRPLYNATGLWVRPHAMFFETVSIDGVSRRRFEPFRPVAPLAAPLPATHAATHATIPDSITRPTAATHDVPSR